MTTQEWYLRIVERIHRRLLKAELARVAERVELTQVELKKFDSKLYRSEWLHANKKSLLQ